MSTEIDPRIKIELERLNTATETINQYEIQVDEARREFESLLKESVDKIKQSANKIGNAIETAKPYYEARLYCNEMAREVQQAHNNYEKSKSTLEAAKEMIFLAEQGLGEKPTLDVACQEMLSHAASRVNESQMECTDAKNFLKMCELKQEIANSRVTKLQSQLKGAIRASSLRIRRSLLLLSLIDHESDLLFLPYYETRANCNGLLKIQKSKIEEMQGKIFHAKMTYNEALRHLEEISEEIHRLRKETKQTLEEYDLNGIEPTATTTNLSNSSSQIESTDEYLDFPMKLSLKSSPIKQKQLDKHSCPHLLRDFSLGASCSKFGCERNNDDSDGMFSPNQTENTNLSSDDIEHWTEIRLSNSNSSSTEHSTPVDDLPTSNSDSSDNSESNVRRKVVAKVIRYEDDDAKDKKKPDGIPNWLTKSTFKNESQRRQSFDLLLDNTKEIFQGLTKSLERRNSESEVSSTSEFFSFGKQALTDEQVENLQFEDAHHDIQLQLSSSKQTFDISKSKVQY